MGAFLMAVDVHGKTMPDANFIGRSSGVNASPFVYLRLMHCAS
jgi:hypothetical protein